MASTELPSLPEYMLTTVDNPFDPFTQWDEWFGWDAAAGYNTPGLLARITHQSSDLSEGDQHLAVQDAIDECVEMNVLGVLRKVKRGDVVNASMSHSDVKVDITKSVDSNDDKVEVETSIEL